jgi:hypothetical protein
MNFTLDFCKNVDKNMEDELGRDQAKDQLNWSSWIGTFCTSFIHVATQIAVSVYISKLTFQNIKI